MSFLRRVLGGDASSGDAQGGPAGDAGADHEDTTNAGPATAEADEAARERDLLREEARRTSSELLARQLRYADLKWTPPAQGGTRRADDRPGDADDS